MDGFAATGEQVERLLEANEQAKAQIEAVAAAGMQIPWLGFQVDAVGDEPLPELGDLAPQRGFGGKVAWRPVLARRARLEVQNCMFHHPRMRFRPMAVCALTDKAA